MLSLLLSLPDLSPLAKIDPLLYAAVIVTTLAMGGWWLMSEQRDKRLNARIERYETGRERFQARLENKVQELEQRVYQLHQEVHTRDARLNAAYQRIIFLEGKLREYEGNTEPQEAQTS